MTSKIDPIFVLIILPLEVITLLLYFTKTVCPVSSLPKSLLL